MPTLPRASTLTLILVTLAAGGCSRVADPNEEGLHEEIAALQEGQEKLREELGEIKELLQQGRRPAPTPRGPDVTGKVFDLADNPVAGRSGARVALVEFTDYQCPYCSRHTTQTHPQIASEYIDGGKIRFASLDYPIQNIHPLAFKAAEASHCAEDQGQFWPMRKRLFANQKSLEPWGAHAEALGLDVAEFEACVSSGKHADAVRGDMAEAAKAGASGTPSFVVGIVDEDDASKVRGLKFIRGAQSFNAFKVALDDALAAAEKQQ